MTPAARGWVQRALDRAMKIEQTSFVASSRGQLSRLTPTRREVGRDAVVLEVPSSLSYRGLVTRTVGASCRVASDWAAGNRPAGDRPAGDRAPPGCANRPGLHRFIDEVVSAVGEAFNNVAIHGYPAGARGTVCVIVAGTADGIEIELLDDGRTFDPNSVDLPVSLEPSESGMGLFIIRAFVDRVEYVAGSPNSLTLFKRFPWLPAPADTTP